MLPLGAAPCADTHTLAGSDRRPQLKQKKTSATLPAPRGAANLALAMAMAMASTAAARQVKQQGNPSCIALAAATATSSPTANTLATTADACKRDEVARGAATGGNAGVSQLASQGLRDQQGQGNKRAGKATGKQIVSVFDGLGWWGPSTSAGRPTIGNALRPGGRAGRPGGMPAQCTVADAGLVRR